VKREAGDVKKRKGDFIDRTFTISKLQAPTLNLQRNFNNQASLIKALRFWSLELL
jgi:hypothetical protein